MILGIVDLARGDQAIDLLDLLQFLLHRQVAGQLVAAVEDLVRLHGHAGAGARVDLDHPQLVDIKIREVVDRRVLRVEAVPVDPPARDRDRPEKLGDRRGGQQALDLKVLAREHLEVAAEDFHRADLEGRSAGPPGQFPQFVEIEMLVEDLPELRPRPRWAGGRG